MTTHRARHTDSLPIVRRSLALLVLLAGLATAQGQAPDQAAMLLDSARRAFNEKNYGFAAQRFKEYLQKFGGNKEAPAARYALALCLVQGPDRDYTAALENLNPLAGAKDMPEHPYVLYYLGLSHRGLGVKALATAEAKPNEAKQHQDNARQRFEEAARHYTSAITAFTDRAKTADKAKPPMKLEWAARARCDLAEMQLRTGKAKEAQATAAPFTEDKTLAASRYHGLGLYYHGFASFLLGDSMAAGRSLSQLTPFADPVFGTHARYLLARVHHHDNERQEAMNHYEGVIADYAKHKAAAGELLKQPERFKNDPEEKARLEQLVRGTPPDHLARSLFFLGVMQYEDAKFAEALSRFAAFVQQFPSSPLAADAQLRQGYCQVQLKQFADAQKTLQPLADKDNRLADQALLWVGKAQIGAGDPAKPPEYQQALKNGMDTLRKAADKANQLAQGDPGAKVRRGEILVELADAQQHANLHKEAAGVYNQVLSEKLLPQRNEELTLSLATAHQLAGDYAESDKVCARFQQSFPKSVLVPAVLFRQAENAHFTTLLAEKLPNPADRKREVDKANDEALKRYQLVVDKYPEFAHVNLARYGLAMALYRKGDLEKAKERLETIPAAERNGELAIVPYHLADCVLRLSASLKADDALAAGKLSADLKQTVELLEAFIGGNPNSPQAPDALLKLGHALQRLAPLEGQPPERAKILASARAAYEALNQRFPKHELAPTAIFERARVLSQTGDVNGAINELRRFTNDPLKAAPVAPLAVLHLATLLRAQNKPQEAADALANCRQAHEANLSKDPARAGWVVLLTYHHGVALREAGKRADARQVLDQVIKNAGDRPEAAEAALRSGQSLKDDGLLKIAEAQKKLAGNLKPEEQAAATKQLDEGIKDMRDAATFLAAQAEQVKQKMPASEARARMMYEAAWAYRTLADQEIAAARKKIQLDQWQKHRDELQKKLAPGQALPAIPFVAVPLTAIPLQAAETSARNQYQALIQAFPDLAINADARFELAELLSDRGEHDAALKLLQDALDKEPRPELEHKVRVRLGVCLQVKGDTKKALDQFQTVLKDPKSAQLPHALYRSAECLMQAGDHVEAAKRLARFRDEGPLQNIPDLTDRALLRLGHALDKLKQWDTSRQAHEQVVNRFPNSPWVAEARYGIGWAWQNLQQFDNAVNSYNQVVGMTATELGARAQLNIGLCRLAQKRYGEASGALLVVPFTYDYPHLSAISLVEAARALAENKQTDQAIRILERVLRDHPETEQAEAAKKRLEELKKL
jgi:TolA-binding protein